MENEKNIISELLSEIPEFIGSYEKIKNGKQGGIYNKNGKPVSFWYK